MSGRARRVEVRARERRVDGGHQVRVRLLAPAAPAALDERLAVAGRDGRVRQQDRVAARDEEVRVPAPVPAVPRAERAAVDEHDQRRRAAPARHSGGRMSHDADRRRRRGALACSRSATPGSAIAPRPRGRGRGGPRRLLGVAQHRAGRRRRGQWSSEARRPSRRPGVGAQVGVSALAGDDAGRPRRRPGRPGSTATWPCRSAARRAPTSPRAQASSCGQAPSRSPPSSRAARRSARSTTSSVGPLGVVGVADSRSGCRRPQRPSGEMRGRIVPGIVARSASRRSPVARSMATRSSHGRASVVLASPAASRRVVPSGADVEVRLVAGASPGVAAARSRGSAQRSPPGRRVTLGA